MRRHGNRQGKKRGAQRMREFGYHPVQVWFDASEWEMLSRAALAARERVATFIRTVLVAWICDRRES